MSRPMFNGSHKTGFQGPNLHQKSGWEKVFSPLRPRPQEICLPLKWRWFIQAKIGVKCECILVGNKPLLEKLPMECWHLDMLKCPPNFRTRAWKILYLLDFTGGWHSGFLQIFWANVSCLFVLEIWKISISSLLLYFYIFLWATCLGFSSSFRDHQKWSASQIALCLVEKTYSKVSVVSRWSNETRDIGRCCMMSWKGRLMMMQ